MVALKVVAEAEGAGIEAMLMAGHAQAGGSARSLAFRTCGGTPSQGQTASRGHNPSDKRADVSFRPPMSRCPRQRTGCAARWLVARCDGPVPFCRCEQSERRVPIDVESSLPGLLEGWI